MGQICSGCPGGDSDAHLNPDNRRRDTEDPATPEDLANLHNILGLVKTEEDIVTQQWGLIQTFLFPTVVLQDDERPIVCPNRLAAQLSTIGVLSHELEVTHAVHELPWDSMMTVIWCQGQHTQPTYQIKSTNAIALRAFTLIGERILAAEKDECYQNVRRDPETLAKVPMQRDDPPRTCDLQGGPINSADFSQIPSGWQALSDWQLDTAWGGSGGWRYAARWESNNWRERDHKSHTPLRRSKLFRVRVKLRHAVYDYNLADSQDDALHLVYSELNEASDLGPLDREKLVSEDYDYGALEDALFLLHVRRHSIFRTESDGMVVEVPHEPAPHEGSVDSSSSSEEDLEQDHPQGWNCSRSPRARASSLSARSPPDLEADFLIRTPDEDLLGFARLTEFSPAVRQSGYHEDLVQLLQSLDAQMKNGDKFKSQKSKKAPVTV